MLLWIGEQVTQNGVGNGVSLVIFAGILLSLPTQIGLIIAQMKAGTPWFNLVILIGAFFLTVWPSSRSRRARGAFPSSTPSA